MMLEALYAQGRKLHRGLYDHGLLKRQRLSRPVICVGNVSVGGTGKTPFLIELVHQFAEEGFRAAVLSRGYRARPTAKSPRIVSDRENIRCEGAEAGDEPLLIAERCPGTPVVIGAKRYESGLVADREFAPDVFVLDDGFQHEALERDLDIVLWDCRDLPSECRQLPKGKLRESPKALARAGAIVLTHAEYVMPEEREEHISRVRAEVERLAPGVEVFEAESRLGAFYRLDDAGEIVEGVRQTAESPAMQSALLMLVSGLARPEGFEAMVRAQGLKVYGHLMRGDHALYDSRAIERIRESLEKCKADRILTTEKDAVKLSGLNLSGLSVWVAPLTLRVSDEDGWRQFLERAVFPLVRNS